MESKATKTPTYKIIGQRDSWDGSGCATGPTAPWTTLGTGLTRDQAERLTIKLDTDNEPGTPGSWDILQQIEED